MKLFNADDFSDWYDRTFVNWKYEWHRKFAWFPMKLLGGEVVWLEFYERLIQIDYRYGDKFVTRVRIPNKLVFEDPNDAA